MYSILLSGEFIDSSWAWMYEQSGEEYISQEILREALSKANGDDLEVNLSSIGGIADVATDMIIMLREYKRSNKNSQPQTVGLCAIHVVISSTVTMSHISAAAK